MLDSGNDFEHIQASNAVVRFEAHNHAKYTQNNNVLARKDPTTMSNTVFQPIIISYGILISD